MGPRILTALLRTPAKIIDGFDGVWTRLTPIGPALVYDPVLSGGPMTPDTPSHSPNSNVNFGEAPYAIPLARGAVARRAPRQDLHIASVAKRQLKLSRKVRWVL